MPLVKKTQFAPALNRSENSAPPASLARPRRQRTLARPRTLASAGLTLHHSLTLSKLSSETSAPQIQMDKGSRVSSRGSVIVLEGLDRSGKTSQSNKLVSHLKGKGSRVESWRFPDRSTSIGQMISAYLSSDSELDDKAIHLLFSANRWEKRSLMEKKLLDGTSLVIDRYSYSGVAYSAAKGLDIEWCKAPEAGLIAPDLVIFLDIPPEKAAERGGYGAERYEQLEFQKEVVKHYRTLFDSSWKVIDGNQPMEAIEEQLKELALDCISTCQKGKQLLNLWPAA